MMTVHYLGKTAQQRAWEMALRTVKRGLSCKLYRDSQGVWTVTF